MIQRLYLEILNRLRKRPKLCGLVPRRVAKTKYWTSNMLKIPLKLSYYDQDKNNEANLFDKIRKIKTKLRIWQAKDLALYGH